MTGPLLMHSLAEFRGLILPLLDAVAARRVVELGGEGGLMTERLAEWCADHDAELHVVDPAPSPHLRALAGDGRVQLTIGKSPAALAGLPRFDAYLVDGDHNHHVVSGELAAIFGAGAGEQPLAILHDVGWPAGRRDMYYDPDDVPAEHRQPFDFEGAPVPGESELQVGRGFSGAGDFAWARHEGGPANGVMTAVEDLLETRPDLDLRVVPCVFGLGVVFPREAPYAARVREILDPFHHNELLARLEENRLELYLEVIDRRRAAAGAERGLRDLVAGLERELEAERAENARLRLALAERDGVAS
jgi:hypothetical protein